MPFVSESQVHVLLPQREDLHAQNQGKGPEGFGGEMGGWAIMFCSWLGDVGGLGSVGGVEGWKSHPLLFPPIPPLRPLTPGAMQVGPRDRGARDPGPEVGGRARGPRRPGGAAGVALGTYVRNSR